MTLEMCLLLSAALLGVGIYGVLTRRNAIGVLIGIELMANAVNINLISFGRFHGGPDGQLFTLFMIALTVAEVAVGLAIVILLHRAHKTASHDDASEMRG